VSVRVASEADLPAVRELWEAFEAECPGPDFVAETWEDEDIPERVREGSVFLAEEEGAAIGFAELELHSARLGWLHTIYVRPEHRRRGVAAQLLTAVATFLAERGIGHIGLEVLNENSLARSVYERLGFSEFSRSMAMPVDELSARLGRAAGPPSLGRVYVQTDDAAGIERAVAQFVPRLGRSERTVVYPPANGWVCVEDELCSREPSLLRRLAQELSYRTGGVVLLLGVEQGAVVRYVLFERGSLADEYASVPEYFGPLAPGDVVALAANPTVVARLTGADPGQVRSVARTASSPAELPAPEELVQQLADVLGLGSGQ
jgi:ribosomal protein S18 acetylase RimI-like enzyme